MCTRARLVFGYVGKRIYYNNKCANSTSQIPKINIHFCSGISNAQNMRLVYEEKTFTLK